jgi:hypothetical protein
MESTLHEPTNDSTWEQLSPLLDEAMLRLGQADRDALVLRFFEGRTLNEVGAALGASEDAAKKRVNRAVEKLHNYFSKRGVVLTTVIIAGTISTKSVQAAPAALAKTITALAISQGAAASGSTLTLVKGALKLMAWTKGKIAVVAGVSLLLAAGAATITVREITAPPAAYLRIEGDGQIELTTVAVFWPDENADANKTKGVAKQIENYNKQRKTLSRVVETAHMVILTDGKSYRMSIASEAHSGLTNDVYDVKADYASDGIDNFELSDRRSPLHRTREGFGGFADSGRVRANDDENLVVQAAWLAYCSKDYFNISSNQTGLKLFSDWSLIWPDYVTNQVTYRPDSTLPQSITGWSRSWVITPRTNSLQPRQAIELKQYPKGFKAWTFTASDPVMVGKIRVPQQITLETFFPKPPKTATTGDDTEPMRKATFTVNTIQMVPGRLDPLPPVTVPDLKVMDSRFEDIAGNFVITSHATPRGWPVRGSKAFKAAAAEADSRAKEFAADIKSYLETSRRVITPP